MITTGLDNHLCHPGADPEDPLRLASVNLDLCGCTLGVFDLCGCILGLLGCLGLVSFFGQKCMFGTKIAIFSTTPRLFSLEAQRLDDNTGHTRRPRWTSGQLFPSLARPDLAVFRPQLAEIGPSLHPDDGKRRHVRESTSFSSQTAPPDPQTDASDPADRPPRRFKIKL